MAQNNDHYNHCNHHYLLSTCFAPEFLRTMQVKTLKYEYYNKTLHIYMSINNSYACTFMFMTSIFMHFTIALFSVFSAWSLVCFLYH